MCTDDCEAECSSMSFWKNRFFWLISSGPESINCICLLQVLAIGWNYGDNGRKFKCPNQRVLESISETVQVRITNNIPRTSLNVHR